MKTFLFVTTLLFSTMAFAQTKINLTDGTSTTVQAGEDVHVTCTAASNPTAKACRIVRNGHGWFSIEQEKQQISNASTNAFEIANQLYQYRISGICP